MMMLDAAGHEAHPKERSHCPGCGTTLIAKCGTLVTWHWAHEVQDCDPWSEPESEWHHFWKRRLMAHGAAIEVVIPPHRADALVRNGPIIELQATFLSAEDIAEREAFYGPKMVWLYRCHWMDRVHFGKRGFWWKHAAKSLTTHRRPVFWHNGDDDVLRVSLGVVESGRVLGRVLEQRKAIDWTRFQCSPLSDATLNREVSHD